MANSNCGKLQKKWLNILMFVNDKPRNKEVLVDYFFKEFIKSSECFYAFILSLKKQLQKIKGKKIKKQIATKYLNYISNLCEKFGFFEEKRVLDELCFKIISPRDYLKIIQELLEYKKKSQKIIKKILEKLKILLESKGYRFIVNGRYKNAYSIYRKIIKKRTRKIRGLSDIFAFRIILEDNSTSQCFEVMNLLHDYFDPDIDRFKDYITIPKINGYQSIHTCLKNVITSLDLPIEVQVRTRNMNNFAEKGFAAHWLYAKNKQSKAITDKEQKLINHLLSLKNDDEFIYFFSFTGDLFKLKKECRAIDFAYFLHTDIGDNVKSIVVNGKSEELDYKIKEGDIIEIIKSPKKTVNEKWLNFTAEKYTIKKIKSAIGLQ